MMQIVLTVRWGGIAYWDKNDLQTIALNTSRLKAVNITHHSGK